MKTETTKSSFKFLDFIQAIRGNESLQIEHMPVNQVQFTITRHLGEDKTITDISVLPADNHCDLDRVLHLIEFMQGRLDKKEDELKAEKQHE